MALIGSISGSVAAGALTSNNAITGTLTIANSPVGLYPSLPGTDITLFVAGPPGGSSKGLFGGDLVVSGSTDIKGNFLLGGTTSTGTFGGDLGVAGRTGLAGVAERMLLTQSLSVFTCNMINQSIFYLAAPTGAVTANFTNVPTTTNRVYTPTVILSQSGTPQIVTTVQIDGGSSSISWANGVTPVGGANKQNVFGFSLIRSGSVWTVLGQMSTYG